MFRLFLNSIDSEAREVNEYDGPSLFNIDKVEQVVDYVEYLLQFGFSKTRQVKPKQILIASPYMAQT